MPKKAKTAKFKNRTAIIILSMVVINLIGIAYGLWDESLNMLTSVSADELGIRFKNYQSEENERVGGLVISYPDKFTMLIEGTVEIDPGTTDRANEKINIDIINDGNIPVVLKNYRIVDKNEDVQLELVAEPEILNPGDSPGGKNRPYLNIKAGEGSHYFEMELNFQQCLIDGGARHD
ncbi:MAG: hypothetical protein GX022_06890 [Clostridiaceae bacterium]|nr:hypothetical protein [Clostridiaceae bacterium]